jgi:hypothetical protein
MPRFARCGLVVIAITSIAAMSALSAQQPPPLATLLERAATYAARYMDVMSTLNIEEEYTQELATASTRLRIVAPRSSTRRVLRADVVLVKVGPPIEWRIYRDVFEVNGEPVRDRADRLTKLILEPVASARQQAERIASENARFNIVTSVGRTLNEPGLPLVFLQASLQPRFQFTLDKREGTTWIVRYVERARPTLFLHNNKVDNPASGRFWIEAHTGEVVKAELIVTPAVLNGTFTTTFRRDDRFGVAVPVELQDQLIIGADPRSPRVEGIGKYSNYRKFQVTTEGGARVP